MTCEGCGRSLDDYHRQVYQLVTGWARSEEGRSSTPPVALRDERRFACEPCALAQIGEVVWPHQATLFDLSPPPS